MAFCKNRAAAPPRGRGRNLLKKLVSCCLAVVVLCGMSLPGYAVGTSTISFTLVDYINPASSLSCTALEGMTWAEFADSDYNSAGIFISSYVGCSYFEIDLAVPFDDDTYTQVTSDEKIEANMTYYVDGDCVYKEKSVLTYPTPDDSRLTSTPGTTDSGSTTPISLTASATTFNVTVPTSLPITLSSSGAVSSASSVSIVNNSAGPVKVSGISVSGANSWSLAAYSTNFDEQKVDLKQFALSVNNNEVSTTGTCGTNNFTTINGGASQTFTYAAKVARQSAAISATTIANVVFTIGWYTAS